LLYLNEHGVADPGDTCDSYTLESSDKIKELDVIYDSDRVTKLSVTTFDGAFVFMGSAPPISKETLYFSRLSNSLIGLYGSQNEAGEIVGISGLRDTCEARAIANNVMSSVFGGENPMP
jgi:hypothetical protein